MVCIHAELTRPFFPRRGWGLGTSGDAVGMSNKFYFVCALSASTHLQYVNPTKQNPLDPGLIFVRMAKNFRRDLTTPFTPGYPVLIDRDSRKLRCAC